MNFRDFCSRNRVCVFGLVKFLGCDRIDSNSNGVLGVCGNVFGVENQQKKLFCCFTWKILRARYGANTVGDPFCDGSEPHFVQALVHLEPNRRKLLLLAV